MKIVILGSNPSTGNKDPKVPFLGTRSLTTLRAWFKDLEIEESDVVLLNVLDKVTKNNRSLSRREIKSAVEELKVKIKALAPLKLICLGKTAEVAFKMTDLEIDQFALPHPSGLNRKINDKEYIKTILSSCKEWLKNDKT